MPELNRDLLREIFYEIIKNEGFNNMDNFMMARKEQFKLVLDICSTVNSVVIFDDKIIVKFPRVEYISQPVNNYANRNDEDFGLPIIGTEISTDMLLFNPIVIKLATNLTSLDFRGFNVDIIPMLRSINHELHEIYVKNNYCNILKAVCQACVNIPSVQHCIITPGDIYKFCDEIKSLRLPCKKLSVVKANFDNIHMGIVMHNLCKIPNESLYAYNPYLLNIRDLTIRGHFYEKHTVNGKVKEFAEYLASYFPNLDTLNIHFLFKRIVRKHFWTWEDDIKMANNFKILRTGIKGCICFKILNYEQNNIDGYPGIRKSKNEYYKLFSITETLNFKLAYW